MRPLPSSEAANAVARLRDSPRPRRLLIVEDDADLTPMISRLARSVCPGVVVDWAVDVDEAIANLERHAYDAVLADYFLRGYQQGIALQELCARSRGTFFAMMSGLPAAELRRQTGELRFPFLAKPFTNARCREFLAMALA